MSDTYSIVRKSYTKVPAHTITFGYIIVRLNVDTRLKKKGLNDCRYWGFEDMTIFVVFGNHISLDDLSF